MTSLFLISAAFVACAVEMVEALTIVLAVGVTRGWRSALIGTGTALCGLAVVVAALGPALAVLPIDSLRLVVGALLLIFGLQWLRKAILRAGGFKALHDEDAIFEKERRAASGVAPVRSGIDWYTFTVSFKGVFLEGLEVAFIVVTFGGAQHNVGLAAIGAAAAAVVVLIAGLALHRPLSRVPENTMKFAVGAMLTTFGIFWAGEGAGVTWPGHDVALVALLPFTLLVSGALTFALRRRQLELEGAVVKYIVGFGRFWYDFIVGEDWQLAAGVVALLIVVHALTHRYADAWWVLPLGVAALLTLSVSRAARPLRRARRGT